MTPEDRMEIIKAAVKKVQNNDNNENVLDFNDENQSQESEREVLQ